MASFWVYTKSMERYTPEQLGKLAELLYNNYLRVEDVGAIHSATVGTYEVVTKDNEGVATIHQLDVARMNFEPKVRECDFIRKAPPVEIHPARKLRSHSKDKSAIVMSDIQIGYRGEETFHDEKAIKHVLGVIATEQPDNVIILGDNVDLPSMSRFEQRPDWQQSTQRSIDRFNQLLAEVRASSPNSQIDVVEGNHEDRLTKYIRKHAMELYGLKRANAESELGVLTLSFLLRTNELEVNYHSGYHNSAFWLNDDIKATHGTKAGTRYNNAASLANSEETSVIFGHQHRIEMAYRTRKHGRTIVAASFGCLCRTDGVVPSGLYTVDDANKTVPYQENWQQGYGIVEFNSRHHKMTPVPIWSN